MAITRRQFVTRLGALAAATGLSQTQLLKITEALGHGSVWTGNWTDKPKVVWVHGAECTGCSTSLLGLFEDVRTLAVEDKSLTAGVADPADGVSTLAALDLAVGGDGTGTTVTTGDGTTFANTVASLATQDHPLGHRTLQNGAGGVAHYDNVANSTAYVANIADVLIDFISLEYHETVMSMGGDLAFRELDDWRDGTHADPFVLVVEGAVQVSSLGGAWDKTGDAAWCSIGMNEAGTAEHKFDLTVKDLASRSNCVAVIPIGQCACFGGYPGCVSPSAEFEGQSQTPAFGVYDYLLTQAGIADPAPIANKVVNVPGCPTNPWWFVLTVVLFLVDFVNDVPEIMAVDGQRRLKAVYGTPIHGPACPRYKYSFPNNDLSDAPVYAQQPGDPGCLAALGCKGLSTNSLCSLHGWNTQQAHIPDAWEYGVSTVNGAFGTTGRNYSGFCVSGGAPCMGCAEKGYPDSYVPFIAKR